MKGIIITLLVSMLALVGCTQYSVPAGHVGIIVDLYGDGKGIQNQVVGVGRYPLGFNQELHLYPTYKIQYPFTAGKTEGSPEDEAIYFQNKDGVKVNMDVAVQAQVINENGSVVKLFTTYREKIEDIIKTQVRNRLRDYVNLYASSMSVEELYGTAKMDMIVKVQKALNDEFSPQGLVIDNVSILGNVRFDKLVEDAISAKIAATQKTLQRDNEVAQAEAEAKIKIAKAKGEAESNRLMAQSISSIMVDWQKVQNSKLAIERWNGVLPQTVANGATPFFDIK